MPDLATFLELAFAVNLLTQWDNVYAFAATRLAAQGGAFAVDEAGTDLSVEATSLVDKGRAATKRIWNVSRWVGAVSALTIYLVLLFGFPALHQGWFVAWLFTVAFAVPALMACIPWKGRRYAARVRKAQAEYQRHTEAVEREVQARLKQLGHDIADSDRHSWTTGEA